MKKSDNKLISVILAIYLSLVTSNIEFKWYTCILFIIKTVFFSIIIIYSFKLLQKVKIEPTQKKLCFKDYSKFFFYIFIVMLIALFVYHPKYFFGDLDNQYDQAISNMYGDWHPIIHTLLFYKVPTLLIQNKLMCSIFHMFFISIILLYFCYYLNEFGFNKKSIFIILSIFILNPTFGWISISPVKDAAFSYCIFLSTLFFISIYLTNGLWLKSKLNFYLFLLSSFGITFFRHNGIFTFFVMMLVLIFLYRDIRKKSVCIFVIILSLRFIFIPFIYDLNNIKKTNINISEMVGVMLNQMSYIYKNNGKITSKQLKKIEKFQDLNIIDRYYDPYDYNSVRFKEDFYNKYSHNINASPQEFFHLWKEMTIDNKQMAFQSYLYTTYCIWHIGIDSIQSNIDLCFIFYNVPDKNSNYQWIIQLFYSSKKVISSLPFSLIFITVPLGLFYIIYSLVYSFNYKRKKEVLLPFIPVLSNVFLMLFLLPCRDTRFLYSNILCAYPLLIFTILIRNKEYTRRSKNEITK